MKSDLDSLLSLLDVTPYAKSEFDKAKSIYFSDSTNHTELDRAWAVFVLSRMSFGSKLGNSFGRSGDSDKIAHSFYNRIDLLRNKASNYILKLKKTVIENDDALNVIRRASKFKNAFFFCDPPYIGSNMGHYSGYTDNDFNNLLIELNKVKGRFMITTYENDLINAFVKRLRLRVLKRSMLISVKRVEGEGSRDYVDELIVMNF